MSSTYDSPALVLLEEVENGVSIGNLGRLVQWIKQSTRPTVEVHERRGIRTQYVLTSHSPIVLREFRASLDSVYQLCYERVSRKSICVDLSSSISALINLGIVEGAPELRESNGRAIVSPAKVDDDALINLWFQQVIGGDGKPKSGG